jgi:cation-transporting P-type ATPase E
VVLDDLLVVSAGDQIVVDGLVVMTESLEVDESLLTGEADPVVKERADEVLSGSFVSAGSGIYKARRVGNDAYAAKLAAGGQEVHPGQDPNCAAASTESSPPSGG